MTNKAGMALVLGLGVVTITTLFIAQRKASPEEPPSGYIPTTNDIMACATMAELEVYYIYIGQLLTINQIDRATYTNLYNAYVARFYELRGWQQ